jgi:DeoR family suf operon transcriptional repressor
VTVPEVTTPEVPPNPTRTVPAVTPTQRAVLYAIRRRGGITVDQLAGALDITTSGARQHLAGLTDAGLVDSTPAPRAPGQRGRGELIHQLTDAADPLFPKAYGELTNQLLGYLTAEAVDEVFDKRRDDRIESARTRLAPRPTFADRVAELAAILDEDGYLASFESQADGTFLVTEHNCAIIAVAREHPHACSSEIDFIRAALPEADVERITHRVSGAHSCTYSIGPSTSGAA